VEVGRIIFHSASKKESPPPDKIISPKDLPKTLYFFLPEKDGKNQFYLRFEIRKKILTLQFISSLTGRSVNLDFYVEKRVKRKDPDQERN
jgi:hypothetical protein